MSFGTAFGEILSKMGCFPLRMAKVLVNSGRTPVKLVLITAHHQQTWFRVQTIIRKSTEHIQQCYRLRGSIQWCQEATNEIHEIRDDPIV